MVNLHPNSTTQEQHVNEILAAYLKAVEAGEKPDHQQWLARYPELAGELASFFANQDRFDRLAAPLRAVLPPPCPAAVTPAPADTATLGTPPPTEIRRLGDYELLEEIARGGMGVVYKARQVSLNRHGRAQDDPARAARLAADVQRFHSEAEAAANLDHPHIVPIYEVGEWRSGDVSPPVQSFSMKLIEGGSLAQWTEVRGQESEVKSQESGVRGQGTGPRKEEQKQAARLLATVARAVHYAHQRGILHRDLKPSNILLDGDGQPYVTDFGLAKRVAGAAAASRPELATQSGAIVGTPSYMAPEQAAGSKGLSCSADLFSLGALLYEILTGRPPFKGATPLDTMIQVRECEPACPRTLNAQIDRDLETVCLKCLEKDPQRRYGSAEALAEDLKRWLAGEPIQARPTGRVERLWRWSRRKPLVAGLLALVLLVALGGFLGVLGQWQVAVANEQQANANAAKAEKKEEEVNQQRNEAQQQRDEAQKQRDAVRALNEKLQATQAQLRSTLYTAHINLAQRAWEEAAVPRVLELLEKHRPKPGEPDLRGFEWHYLHRLCQADALLTLKGNVNNVAFSRDGKRLVGTTRGPGFRRTSSGAMARYDPELKVWDAQTGQELLTLTLKGAGRSVVFSPDGKRLASKSDSDNTVKVWDAQTGKELHTHPLKGQNPPVRSLVFSTDSQHLAGAAPG